MKLGFLHGPLREERGLLPPGLAVVAIEHSVDKGYSRAQLRRLSLCDALYVTAAPAGAEVFDACPGLKIVQSSGAGHDGIDIEAATARGVLCCNNADTNSGRTADFTMMATLNLLRNHIATVNAMQGGLHWEAARREGIAAMEVAGKTLGILGFGNIGHKLALRAHAFDMNILYCDSNPRAHQEAAKRTQANRVSRDELCRRADVISVHVPLDESTRNMLGEREFALMKKGAFLVCTARGGIVDERALRRALDSGRVAGAAMDVFSAEPTRPDNPLIGARNLYPTPHVASRGKEGVLRSFLEGIANIRRYVDEGRLPRNILNPEARQSAVKAGKKAKPVTKADSFQQ